jgi:hypothetical protein
MLRSLAKSARLIENEALGSFWPAAAALGASAQCSHEMYVIHTIIYDNTWSTQCVFNLCE